jgi:gamma-glutamyl hydrolase
MIAARHLFSLAAKENANGGYFPLWGTCLGFQTLSVLVSSIDILDGGFDSENLPLPLNFTSLGPASRLFRSVSPAVMNSLAKGA